MLRERPTPDQLLAVAGSPVGGGAPRFLPRPSGSRLVSNTIQFRLSSSMRNHGSMDARRLKAISQIPKARRFSVLGEGLELLADNVATLDRDATMLGASRRHRGSAVLRCFAEEEAAKIMILVDLARAGWNDGAAVKACTANFYSHLARGLYVRAYGGSPADLAEVRGYVDHLRQQYYLDGPLEVDWIFGNEVLTDREERLYVDFVVDEYGDGRWTGPASRAAMLDEPYDFPAPTSIVVELAAAMRQIGLLTEEGLVATRTVWDGVVVDDTTHWVDFRPLNIAVIEKLASGSRRYTTEDHEALRFVVEHWIFPLTSLDLTLAKVDRSDLEEARDRQLAREMGVLDEVDGGYGYV
jgi:AbiV family abortive infection protein